VIIIAISPPLCTAHLIFIYPIFGVLLEVDTLDKIISNKNELHGLKMRGRSGERHVMFVGGKERRNLVDNISPGVGHITIIKAFKLALFPTPTIMTPQVRKAKMLSFPQLPQPRLLSHGYLYFSISSIPPKPSPN
jgi:hypothetical protein